MRPRAALFTATIVTAVVVVRSSHAHDFEPGVLAIVEEPREGAVTHRYKLTPPTDPRGPSDAVRVRFPSGCVVSEAPPTLSCGARGLTEPMAFEGLVRPAGSARMIVSLRRKDGAVTERIIGDEAPFLLASPPPDAALRAWSAWAALGARHLLGGPDHVAFLLGLLALVPGRRDLFLAITAFSLGHALSLGLSVTGLLAVPVAPTEALIAVSVVLVAREALATTDPLPGEQGVPITLLQRAPFLAALLFGLVHGLGFASALGSRGFPREGLASALFSFHVGIELAQLVLVAAAAAAWCLLRRAGEMAADGTRTAALYLIGASGAFWTCDRMLLVWRGG